METRLISTVPQTLTVQPDRIPPELKAGRRHVAWKWRMDGDKPTKPPVNPDTGKIASATGPSTWGTFDDALDRMRRDNLPGIGRVLTSADDIVGIDLDHCVDPETHQIETWAQKTIDPFMPTYAEYSPNGTGIRLFVRGKLTGKGCKVGDTEIYDNERYLTLTGHPIPGMVSEVAQRQDALTALHRRLGAVRDQTAPAALLQFVGDLDDAAGAALLRRIRPQGPGALRANTLTQRIWDLANDENDVVMKQTDNGPVAYAGESERRFAVLCALYGANLNDDEVKAAFKATYRWRKCVAAHGEKDTERRLTTLDMPNAKGFAQQQRENAAQEIRAAAGDGGTAIDAGNHNLPEVTRQAWDALMVRNDPPHLYQHGDVPTRLQSDTEGRIMLVPLTEHRLRCEVAQAADWHILKGKERQPVAAEPPLSVIQNMLAQADLPLPVLRQIAETPVFAPDGRLIETPGYDATSGIYYRPAAGLTIPPVPARPTADDVKNARTLICDDLLGDFPFTEQADLAAAVALNLLPYIRPMITSLTPMHGIESPTVGSGKGLLGDVLVRPAFGRHGGVIAEARDDDEWRKRIGAKLREGSPIIHIDNVTRPLDSGALAMALTTDIFSDRILGLTATFRVAVRNIWMFTANNPSVSLEIARRTIRIRIDTNEEKPWRRTTFKHKNLRAWVDTRRGDLIHAALTLIRAWIVAGKPMADVTLGSYEEWAATMGGILATAGITGFLDNLTEFYEAADLEGAAWRQFVALWWDKHQSNKAGVAKLFELATEADGLNFGKGDDKAQRTSFGAQLTKQRDRIYDGYRIAYAGEHRRAKQWQLLRGKSGGCEPLLERFTQDLPDIATDTEGGVNLCEPFSTPPAEEKLNQIGTYISRGPESEMVHTGSHPSANPLVGQEKKSVNLGMGGSHSDSPGDDDVLWQWIADVDSGHEEEVPDAVRQCAQRHGFTFDSFGDVRLEAARLAAQLVKEATR